MKFQKTDIGKRLDHAFLKLYYDKPIEKITIREITDLAGCNRRTYYNYYEDIYDQKKTLNTRFFNGFKEVIARSNGRVTEEAIEYFQKNTDYLRAFLGKKVEFESIKKIIQTLTEAKKTDKSFYESIYEAFGALAVINCWDVREGEEKRPSREELLNFLNKMRDMK